MTAGEAFEKEVMAYAENLAGTFGIQCDHAKVYHRKGYPSIERGKPIVIDVSIELFRPGSIEPWLILAFECKDYKLRVKVGQVEEFHSKLEQIGVHGCKGYMACRNGFQESALNYAKSKRIGLVRIRPGESPVVLMEIDSPPDESITLGLTQPSNWEGFRRHFYAISTSGVALETMENLVHEELCDVELHAP